MNENDNTRYCIAGSKIIHETFDDEVIISNLERGHYFSAEGAGAEIWQHTLTGSNVTEIVEHFSGRYPGDRDIIASSVRQFVDRLLSESLITPAENAETCQEKEYKPVDLPEAFTPPVLHKYTDMEELLRLDPIHEVDDTGWPNVKG